MKRLLIYQGNTDISDAIELKNGRALPGGWSQREIHYENQFVGWLESGCPMDFQDGFRWEIRDADSNELLESGT